MTANLILQAIDKNSNNIVTLIEVSRRNSELSRHNHEQIASLQAGTVALQLAQLRTEATLKVFQQHTDEAIERLTASNERIEQLLDYLIRRDLNQIE